MESLYNKACRAANMGNYDYAIELFREVLRHEPEHPEARVLLRGTERRRTAENAGIISSLLSHLKVVLPLFKAQLFFGKPLKKLECYEDALEHLPSKTSILISAGKSARKAGIYDAAITVFKDVIARSPENKRALAHAGSLLEQRGDRREALKFLNRLRQLEPSDRDLAARVKNLEAEAHMQESKMEEAESFRDMIKDKDAAEESVKRFETVDEKRVKQIQQAYQEVKEEPDNISKIIRLASLLLDDNQDERALKLLQKAGKKYPDSFDIRQKLGDLQIRMLEKRERALDEKLKDTPDGGGALRQRREEISRKRREIAVREYRWRVERHPTDRKLRLQLGHALFETGDLDAAIASFQQAGQDVTLELDAATMLGRCFARKKQYDLAAEQFKRALGRHKTMDERGMNLYYELASALDQAGEVREALDIYKRLYSMDIGFKDVAGKMEELRKKV